MKILFEVIRCLTANTNDKKSEVGKRGEEIACEYLEKNGYRIIERNFRKPWGEIDVIAQDTSGVIDFIEVKAMKMNESLAPEDNLTASKLKKLKRTAAGYAASHGDIIRKDIGWRIDLIAIDFLEGNGVQGENYNLRLFKNIA